MKILVHGAGVVAPSRRLMGPLLLAMLAGTACSAADEGDPESTGTSRQAIAVQQTLDHVLIGTDGSAWQTIRYPNTTWDQYSRVPTTGLPSSRIGYLTEEAQGDEGTKGVHYMTISSDHRMFHAIRFPGPTWSRWNDASAATNAPVGIQYAVMANDGPNLQVCAVGTDQHLYHTARFSVTSQWQQLNDTNGVLGAVATSPWAFDCAASSRGLYVVVISNHYLWWGRRNPDSTWRRITAIPTNGLPSAQAAFTVSIAADPQGKMFVVAGTGSALYFAAMTPDETWSSWQAIPGAPSHVSLLPSSLVHDGVDLQLVGVETNWPGPGYAWHTIWSSATQQWSGFGQIQGQAGQRGRELFTATAAAVR